MRVHLVRHGEVHNPRSVMYGRLPRFRLSAHGVRQAEEAERLAALEEQTKLKVMAHQELLVWAR